MISIITTLKNNFNFFYNNNNNNKLKFNRKNHILNGTAEWNFTQLKIILIWEKKYTLILIRKTLFKLDYSNIHQNFFITYTNTEPVYWKRELPSLSPIVIFAYICDEFCI